MAPKTKSTENGGHTHAERSHRRPSSPAVADPQLEGVGLHGFQHAAGNLAIQRLLRGGRVQAKLTVNQPGDIYEQEADRMAAQVMRMPAQSSPPQIQRLCSACEEEVHRQVVQEEEDLLQAKELPGGTSKVTSWLASRIEAMRGGGTPLPASERTFFEPRFGRGFSDVRVHTDSRAAEAARAVSARAFTVGRDVVFGAGQYAPGNREGRKLLAHELTHAVQQAGSVPMARSSGRAPAAGSNANTATIRTFTTSPWLARQSEVCSKKPTFPEKILCEVSARGKYESIEKWIHALRALFEKVLASQAQNIHRRLISDKDALGIFFQKELHPYPAQRDALLNILEKHFSTQSAPRGTAPAVGAAPKPQLAGRLKFYHGTRWSIALKIPKNVKAIGGGDFAAGFYTHQDADDAKALGRAKKWAIRVANQKPKEPNAGVIVFKVPTVDYQNLLRSNAKVFDLTQKDQKDYKQRQQEWIEFVTSYGREEQPTFRPDRKEWAHESRDPQPQLGYDVVKGPFYRPIKGTASRKPKPSEFDPYAEGMELPHQVTWANKGVDLLNSSNVKTELRKYDAKSGKPVPVAQAITGAPPYRGPSIGPASGPAKPQVFCRGGSIGCATWDYMSTQFYLSEDQARKAIDIEHKLLLKHRPPAPPQASLHEEAPSMKRHRLLREEARRRVLKSAGLEGLINSKYAR